MLKDASKRRFDVVMAWAIDRLGRSLIDLLGTIQTLEACAVDLYLDQQSIDTTTPAGKLMFQVTGAFAEFERSMIRQRVRAGLKRAVEQGKQLGRPRISPALEKRIRLNCGPIRGFSKSPANAVSGPAPFSASNRRWKALSTSRPHKAERSQMKRMTARRIGSWLIRLGLVGVVASFVWWQNFYSPMIGHPPLECLYQLTGPCRTGSNVAGFFGAAAYDARLFWASGISPPYSAFCCSDSRPMTFLPQQTNIMQRELARHIAASVDHRAWVGVTLYALRVPEFGRGAMLRLTWGIGGGRPIGMGSRLAAGALANRCSTTMEASVTSD